MDTDDIPVLAYRREDRNLATFDLTGKNVFYLLDNAEIVQGAREALRKMKILKG